MGNSSSQEEAPWFLATLTVKALPVTDPKYLPPCDPLTFDLALVYATQPVSERTSPAKSSWKPLGPSSFKE